MNCIKKVVLFSIFLVCSLPIFIGCDSEQILTGEVQITTPNNSRQIKKNDPNMVVTLTYNGVTDNVTIRHTTDGSNVTESSSSDVTVLITEDTVIKAKVFKKGYAPSNQSEKRFYKVEYEYTNVVDLQNKIEEFMNDSSVGPNGDYNHIGLSSTLTNLDDLFHDDKFKTFNGDISAWDVSNITSLSWTFGEAEAFNKPLNDWNVSNVDYMGHLFWGAKSFNQPLNNWDTSNVTIMSEIFSEASAFNHPLDKWDVSKVEIFFYSFGGATSFNQPLDNWDVSSAIEMGNMFYEATSFNQPLGKWDVSKVENMNSMFAQAATFNQPLNSWNVSNVTDMGSMFHTATSFDQPLASWNVEKVINADFMFSGGNIDETVLFNQDISGWKFKLLESADGMFNYNNAFSYDLSDWETHFTKSSIGHLHIIANCPNMSDAKLPAKLKN